MQAPLPSPLRPLKPILRTRQDKTKIWSLDVLLCFCDRVDDTWSMSEGVAWKKIALYSLYLCLMTSLKVKA